MGDTTYCYWPYGEFHVWTYDRDGKLIEAVWSNERQAFVFPAEEDD